MALAFAIDIEFVEEGGIGAEWAETLEDTEALEQDQLIRLPGTSRSGPCPHCAQFFHMLHDGSGSVVPLRPLHPNCVCRDIPKPLSDLMDGPSEKDRNQWIEKAGKRTQQAVLGKTAAQAVARKLILVESLYAAGKPGTENFLGVSGVAKQMAKRSKAAIVSEAKRAGIRTRGRSRADLIIDLVQFFQRGRIPAG